MGRSIRLALVLLLAAAVSCSSGASDTRQPHNPAPQETATVEVPAPGTAHIPTVPLGELDRRVTSAVPTVEQALTGSAAIQTSSSFAADGQRGVIASGTETGWALYRLPGMNYGSAPRSVSFQTGGVSSPSDRIWLALADYGDLAWRWLGPVPASELGTQTVQLSDFGVAPEDAVSPNGNTFLGVVAGEGAALELRRMEFTIENAPARIGSFNIEWFERPGFRGDYQRTERDLADLARIINLDYRFDLVGLSEITGREPLDRLLTYLPDYRAVFIADGAESQHLALLYRTDRVEISESFELDSVRAGNQFLRPGLVVRGSVEQFDFQLLTVHLKAFDDQEARQTRLDQAEAINSWLDGQLADPTRDNDIVLTGDFNDTVGSDPMDAIAFESGERRFTWLDSDYGSGPFSVVGGDENLDHLGVSTDHTLSTPGVSREYIDGSADIETLTGRYANYPTRLSDHRPVGGAFRVGGDDD